MGMIGIIIAEENSEKSDLTHIFTAQYAHNARPHILHRKCERTCNCPWGYEFAWWSSRVSAMGMQAFVHDRGSVTIPTCTRNPPSLTLHTARFDKSLDAYTDGGLLRLPLTEDEHVAALGNVGCRSTGLMCTFLVIATRKKLTIGRLDIGKSSYEATGTIVVDDDDEPCLECWLIDGPTLVAWYPDKVVVASEHQGHGSLQWKADMLQRSFQRVFVAGNRVLCVGDEPSSSSSLVRSADLLTFTLPSGDLARADIPCELDPSLLTCVEYVRSSTRLLSYKVVFGTSDGKLKCCSEKNVILEVTLEESPLSISIAESASGVPVLVVCLGGMDRKVVTFFAESLHQINSWTGIHQVVVDDLARLGQEQMLLITQPSTPSSFEHYLRVPLLEPGAQSASEEHRSKILKSINEALEIRLQEGVRELQATEQRRQDKMQMLTSACNLMQTIANHQESLDLSVESCFQLPELYMNRCFLLINVTSKSAHLRRSTLFATSLHGFVKSSTSYLGTSFLFSFPLKDCNFPLHIIFAGEVTGSKIYTEWIHSIQEEPISGAGSLTSLSDLCEKLMSVVSGEVSKDELMRAVSMQTSAGNYTWSLEESLEERTKVPFSSMYVQDLSLVSKKDTSVEKLYGPKLVGMVIQFADVFLDEVHRCASGRSELILAEVQAATDRSFCHLLSSIMYNSFGDFQEVT